MKNCVNALNIGICRVDQISMNSALQHIRSISERGKSGYVVTPNIDHLQRLLLESDNRYLSDIYHGAELSLCDSRIVELLLNCRGKEIPEVIPGSSLTEKLFKSEFSSRDRIYMLGGEETVAQKIREAYSGLVISHHNPSMGFINRKEEVQNVINLICEKSPTHVFLAVGSPQQEIFASKLCADERFKGVALCIGASLLFLIGDEKRAPTWIQHARMEWLFRMIQNPVRLGRRYFANAKSLPAIYRLVSQNLNKKPV